MKVLHISPTYFSPDSHLGGGERYAMDLAQAISQKAETKFVSFGKKRESSWQDKLKIEIYPYWFLLDKNLGNPIDFLFLKEIIWADIVHCHQIFTMPASLSLIVAKALGKKFFVTHSGSFQKSLINKLHLWNKIDGFLLLSKFSASLLQSPEDKTAIIYGGVDTEKFKPTGKPRRDYLLCVSRLIPHKGIDFLIKAVNGLAPLKIVGTESDQSYLSYLKGLAAGKNIEFISNAKDEELVSFYQNALLTIQPSVYVDYLGRQYTDPELLGLTSLESMSCGTPVLVTNVGSLPELVNEKVGWVVEPSNPDVVKKAIESVWQNRSQINQKGQLARENILQNFTWDKVVDKCLLAYGGHNRGFNP